MSVHTTILQSSHGYTRSRSPWILTDYRKAYGRLLHYISGGGMRTFGRTVRQEEVRLCRRRFLVVSSVLAFLWLIFYIF